MKAPKHYINKADYKGKDAEIFNWGLLIDCWHCFQQSGDLRSISPEEIKKTAEWLEKESGFLEKEETDWCRKLAEIDRKNATTAHSEDVAQAIGEWTYRHAVCISVLKKLATTFWKDPDATEKKFQKRRKDFERLIQERFGDTVDWSLTPVSGSGRNGALERALKNDSNNN